jgi:hypothetical protein
MLILAHMGGGLPPARRGAVVDMCAAYHSHRVDTTRRDEWHFSVALYRPRLGRMAAGVLQPLWHGLCLVALAFSVVSRGYLPRCGGAGAHQAGSMRPIWPRTAPPSRHGSERWHRPQRLHAAGRPTRSAQGGSRAGAPSPSAPVRKGAPHGGRKRWKALRGVVTEGKKMGRVHGVLQGTPEDTGHGRSRTSPQASPNSRSREVRGGMGSQ